MIKPSLVDPNIFKKLSNKHTVDRNLVNKITKNISDKIVNIFDSYKNLILILIVLGLVLYLLYRYNKKTKNYSNY